MATLILAPTRVRPTILAALIAWTPIAGAAQNATPITIASPPAVPSTQLPSADVQATIVRLERFIDQTDHYIQAVHATTENYRRYLEQNQSLWASCQVEFDLGGYENSPFSGLAVAGDNECRHFANLMEEKAQAVAAELDVAIRFQREAQHFASEVAMPRVERLRTVQRLQRLDKQVQRGLADIQEAREGYAPWMN